MSYTVTPARGRILRALLDEPPEIFHVDEIDAMYGVLHSKLQYRCGLRNLCMVQLMHRCALRKGEVLNLRTDRIRLHDAAPMVLVRKSKNDRDRNVPIDPRILPTPLRWERARPAESEWFFCTLQVVGSGFAKGNPVGSQLSEGVLWDLVVKTARSAGVTRSPVKPHMFRHTCATDWLREGFPLEAIRRLLGHSNIRHTQRYVHVSDDELQYLVYGLAPDLWAASAPVRRAHEAALQVEHPRSALQRFPQSQALPIAAGVRRATPAAAAVVGGGPGVAPSPDGYRSCPWCAEKIRAAAVKCRYCHSHIEEGT